MSEPAVELTDLTVAYRGHPALHHVTGRFESGSLTAVVGPNGAGKSTLLGALAGRVRPNGGVIRRDPALASRLAWMPQQHEIDRTFPLRVIDLVALGRWRQAGALAALDETSSRAVGVALDAVGLAGFERRLIGELSAGQFQRALFARVLAQDARLILLDEPFNAIDARTTADLLDVVAGWHAEGRTVVAVSHDLELVRSRFEETLLLARRPIAWGPTADVLTSEHLDRARRQAEVWDDEAAWCRAAARAPSASEVA